MNEQEDIVTRAEKHEKFRGRCVDFISIDELLDMPVSYSVTKILLSSTLIMAGVYAAGYVAYKFLIAP